MSERVTHPSGSSPPGSGPAAVDVPVPAGVRATVPGQRNREAGAPGRSPARRPLLLLLGLPLTLLVLAVSVWASLVVGTGDVSVADVTHGLLSPDLSDKGQLIVAEVRIPRTVTGLLAGVALGLAGTVMQGVARNPLADPGILGVNAGASVCVVFAMSVLGFTAASQFVWFGFLGAFLAAVLVFGVGALGREGATPVKLALAGAATSAVLGSLTTAMLLTDRRTFDEFRFWQVGALTARETDVLWQVGPFLAVGTLFALLLGPHLNALSLGDDIARGLGQRVGLARVASGAAVVLLCGGATAVAGPISFVGLVIPHAVRLVTGPDYRWILPFSALLAPVLVLLADIVGRMIAPPGEVQVGIITAAIGAGPFIVLVRRRRLAEL